MVRFILIIVLSGISLYSSSQKASNPGDLTTDSAPEAYYEDLSQLLALRTYLLVKYNQLEVSRQNKSLLMLPNSPLGIGLGFNYRGLGLGLGIGLPKGAQSKRKYGSTSRFDL